MSADGEKDRRSRMATSTVNQAPKKGGAGGAYTWGTAGDVTDFLPTQVVQQSVVTAAAPVYAQPAPAAPFTANVASPQQFPALGTQPAVAPGVPAAWTSPPQVLAAPAPRVQTVMMTAPAAAPVVQTVTANGAIPAQSVTIRSSRPSIPQAQPGATRIISGQTFTVTSSPSSFPTTMSFPEQGYPVASGVRPANVVRTTAAYDKDRRSRMSTSTVNQAPKKGGAGGAYTWGTAGDVTDFLPTQVVQQGVVTAAAPVYAPPAPASPFTANVASPQEFPALGAQAASVPSPAAAWSSRPTPAAMTLEASSTAAEAAMTSPVHQVPASPAVMTSPARHVSPSTPAVPSASEAVTERTEAADSTKKD
eukprot:CAMPEP_0197638112 /NCGR_PEP_ID=MMETSP1338-20131121/13130_1 /TAXON_ID=43686 ORGANISM="Pelagodinium beii, Strain RCC1491" /NCGR_SAMPLE_ID=MMETSP1338 /ASSEMBLY_ACC=CAM_ASM_000754 /LENGTH=362 /DNA_ID=CAMNT_0043210633 /DNA_START=69 /DNA_END=1154 /DNA_ORIENTATION=-